MTDKELRKIDFSLREISSNLKKEPRKDYTEQYNFIHIITASIVLLTTGAILLSGFILFSYFNEIGIKSLFVSSETQTNTLITIFFILIIYIIYSTAPSFIQIAIINFSTKKNLTHKEKIFLILQYLGEGIVGYILIIRLFQEGTLSPAEIILFGSIVMTSITFVLYSNLTNKIEYLFLSVINWTFLTFSSLLMPAKNIYETIHNGEYTLYFFIAFSCSLFLRCICLWIRDNKITLIIPILLIFSLLNFPTNGKSPNVKEFIIRSIGLADINNKPYLIEKSERYDIILSMPKGEDKIFCGKLLWNNGNTAVFLPYYEDNSKNNFKIPSQNIMLYQGKYNRELCTYIENLNHTIVARIYNETIKSYIFMSINY